ncbi:MAG: 2,3-bisphosphoglycerate-independent phosphoglycerate mutase [Minisyncoccia bacterium]
MNYRVILIILDGWGEGRKDYTNPIYIAKKEFLDYARNHFPFFLLQASGIAVGLPWGEEGNSEIGHLILGCGAVYYQNYSRITLSIKNGDFFENDTLNNLLNHAIKNNSNIHLIGLLTEGIVHASFEHLVNILEFFRRKNFNRVYLHLFLDGRDSPPQSGVDLLKRLDNIMKEKGVGKIATICGRSYGMDKNENWEVKTAVAFYLITNGIGNEVEDYISYIEKKYKEVQNFIDENLEPLVVDKNGIVRDNDSIFFFNIRKDGIRQIFEAFVDKNFDKFTRPEKKNLFIASIVEYIEKSNIPCAFPPQKISTNLTKIISENGLKQLKITEKAKAYPVTYCFNGLYKDLHPGEFWKILPSSKIPFSENPLMQSENITNLLIQAIKENIYSFILVNYVAPDIIGHTGNINLAVKVAEGLDKYLKMVYDEIKDSDWVMIITSDHGNMEKMLNFETGKIDTTHNDNPVPCYIIGKDFYIEKKDEKRLYKEEKEIKGTLANVAPTILYLMGLNIPKEMEKPLVF